MAGAEIEMPANGASDWSDFVTQVERQRKGFMQISIDTSSGTEKVTAGSVVEINGSLYQFTSDEEITGSGKHIHFTVSGSSVTVSRTDTDPSWDDAKQGFYDGNERYAIGGNRSLDIGMVAFFVSQDRFGWLACDGSTISNVSNPEYSWLIAVLKEEIDGDSGHPCYHADSDKVVLPDGRGYALRGKTGSSVSSRDMDGDRDVGHFQDDANAAHTHTKSHSHSLSGTGNHTHTVPGRTTGGSGANAASVLDGSSTDDIDVPSGGTHTHTVSTDSDPTGSSGSTEAVMKNIAMHMMIKY